MVSLKERVKAQTPFDGQVGERILKFISDEKVVTLEMIVERFPWVRWGDLFSILGRFRREGLLTVHQAESIFEMRIKGQ